MVKVSVVIPTLASEETYPYLKVCVESLRNAGFGGSIIVVSNGGNTKPNLEDIFGISQHLHTPTQGQCNAVNQGVQVMPDDTEYILVSNDDMYYAPGWDKHLFEEGDDGTYPLVFSPNLVEPENNTGSAAPFLKAPGGYTLDEFKQELVDEFINKAVDLENRTQPGFNLPFFIRKDVWRVIGGYDEKYDPWGSNSDTDLQTKINHAGIIPLRDRSILVYHFSNKSGTFDGTHQDAWQRNWDYFHEKWGFDRDTLGSDVWYNTDMLPKDSGDIKYEVDWAGKYLER
jgi:glycosyltransferase involved in cell wall biosynthesis